MTNASSSRSLALNYKLAALAAITIVGLILVGLGFLNKLRGEAEAHALGEKLCGALPEDLVQAIERFVREQETGSQTGTRAWVILDGMLGQSSDGQMEVRVLQHTTKGWREWRRFTEEPSFVYETPLLDHLNGATCSAKLDGGTVRAVRRIQREDLDVLLIAERQRR